MVATDREINNSSILLETEQNGTERNGRGRGRGARGEGGKITLGNK
jgi:hypothetical protein